MIQWQFHTPDGVSDLLPEECAEKRRIEQTIRSVFEKRGYFEIETPTLSGRVLYRKRHCLNALTIRVVSFACVTTERFRQLEWPRHYFAMQLYPSDFIMLAICTAITNLAAVVSARSARQVSS